MKAREVENTTKHATKAKTLVSKIALLPPTLMNGLSRGLSGTYWIPRTRVLFLDLISPEVLNVLWMLTLLAVGRMEIIPALNLFYPGQAL